MDSKTRGLFNIIIIIMSITIAALMTVISTPVNTAAAAVYFTLLVTSVLSRHILYNTKYKSASKVTFLIDIVLIYLITLQDMTQVWEVYFFVEIIDAVLLYPLRFSAFYVVVNYASYIIVKYLRYIKYNYFDWEYFSRFLYNNLFLFLFIFIFTFIVNKQISCGDHAYNV